MLKYLLLSAAAIAAPAAAQSLDQPSTNDDRIVVTATRAEQSVREVGQAITVIDRDEIERRQTVVVSDLLATMPGVTVTRNGSIGGFTGVRLRGAEAEQTLVVIDGVRVNDPSSPGGGFDFANLLSSSVERIEILRGPNSVPWGSQAIGGVVNIITAQPTEGLRVRGNAEYGYADQVFTSAGVAGGTGGLTGSLTGGYLRTDGISSAAVGSERDGYRQYGANGRLGYEIVPGIGVDLRGWYAHSRARLDGFPAPAFTFADTNEYSTMQEVYGYAGVHADLADGRFRNRAAFTIADINRDNYAPDFGDEPSFIGRGRSERYEYQGDFRLIEQARLVGGVEHETSRYGDDFARYSVGITSVYGQLIVKPVDMLTLTGGVRNDDHDQFGSHTTFGGDAALALDTGTTLRASYGEGFKAPTLYQLYSDFGNGRLDPETARNYDLGVEQTFLGGRARVGATYFNRRTKNQINFRSCTLAERNTAGSICVGRPFGVYDNIQRADAEGVELTIALMPVDGFTVTGNYNYIDSENRTPGANFGRDLARRPHQTVTMNADYRWSFGLSLGGTITHVGDSFDNAANTVRLDGYVLAGLRAEFPIGERLVIYGRVDNLFDEDYRSVAGYGTVGRAAFGGIRVKLDQ
ncbi:TonB-dependent receptor plug domain-containing protein [Sphingomonas mollis]|uniref:TonB-dependent receptor n=1 Tax=Sphingomonas mollis TaxID=2795726 RepID=A0ABS0XJK7_9SPHN|nr:TonB-dependent receptor [Sphingomonas sp. BT553]MBJ6120221.1 TonB-dependent receptor [Sphingomonas sp. BT553]